jgi:uncharacterized protein YfaS (alpha-2-macroglobulin family)
MNKKWFSQAFTTMGAFFALLFGRLSWSSPPWIHSLRNQAMRRPKSFSGSVIAIFLMLFITSYGYYYYKNLPKPQLITAFISVPNISIMENSKLIPHHLIINFGISSPQSASRIDTPTDTNLPTLDSANGDAESQKGPSFNAKAVAPLKEVGQHIDHGIEIKPAIKGKWFWESDSRLVFIPLEDWPAGQKFDIHFDKKVFASHVELEDYDYSFQTLAFTAKISEFSFYQDPVNAKLRQAVATVNFNFPVDPTSFENSTVLTLQALKDGKLRLNTERFKFKITYDEFKRIAYLRSEVISLPEVSRYLMLTINKGLKSLKGPGKTADAISKNLLIPDAKSYFKITSATAAIIRNEQDKPEQLLAVETSLGVTEEQLAKSMHVYLLPVDYPATSREPTKKNYEWQNPGEVTAGIISISTPLPMLAVPADRNFATLHSYKFNAQTPRYIYLKVDKGLQGFGGFVLNNGYSAIIKVPEYPKEISFLHKGALLALNSEKKLSVLVRGVPAVKFNFARLLPSNINQLITQTQGNFNNPFFINQSFNQQNISQISSEIQQFDALNPGKQQYTALDFNKYLSTASNASGPQGLFLLEAVGWDSTNNIPLDVRASRLILATDLGLVVKDNRDGSHDVFVQSITQGVPLPNVNVSVLGKNGLPLLTYTTDAQGRANFPTLNDFVDDREPVVYLANLENDTSFIPYNNPNRQLNYSRYDIGGIYSNYQDQHSLSAYLFSDRGVYRPSDTVHVGMIVKQAYAQAQPPGLLLEASVLDPRGNTVRDYKFNLDASGYAAFDLPTTEITLTGLYQVNLYIVKDKQAANLLGSTSFRVAEFQPDRMRIKSIFSQEPTDGWVNPQDLDVKVQLWNLYGTPAVDRRISGKILLTPKQVEFKNYPNYIFADPLLDPSKSPKTFTDDLTDATTNEKGEAEFKLNLQRFDKATYQLSFFGEGFEAEGGRSVATQSTILVSPLAYFIGYKPEGDLTYIKQNSQIGIHWIAINPQLQTQAIDNLRLQLLSLQPVTTLVKKPNGTYQYQSIIQSKVISTTPFAIEGKGTQFVLPTQNVGNFAISILDENNSELSHLKFSVIGASQRPLAKNAELNVKLNKSEFKAGEDIELQITAPYTGAGLITLERDKVYATQWFKTSMTSSVQRIHIPDDFQGNGYVNVAFVRDWNSPDIYVSPLSYSVVPFNVNHENHNIQITLNSPDVARPGEPFTITYKSDKPGKIIVFAVDEGILQVSNYPTPDPPAFFFQKRALEVLTQQTVDQILPQYIRERELSAVGGDGGEEMLAKHLNPFKRKTDVPVVYWSGIVETDSMARQLVYTIPDYFNGTLRVMAVAVSSDSVGAAEKTSQIRGNFIINPNVPTFVSPQDVFEITASVANNVQNLSPSENVFIELMVSPELEIIGPSAVSLNIPKGQEQTVRFKIRAGSSLGSAKLTLMAKAGNKSSTRETTLSVRPASAYTTTITSGISREAKKSLAVTRSFYPEYLKRIATFSSSPMILATGLHQYLNSFPYGCTEQLISKGMPLLAMANQSWLVKDMETVNKMVTSIVQMLSQRQMSNGSFSYWPSQGEANYNTDFSTVYAMHFLTEAKAQGFNIPSDIFNGGIAYLKDLAAKNPSSFEIARIQAYAIYVLTRNEIVTSNFLSNLQLYLDKEQAQTWQQDITGAYIASSYQLLKSFAEANELIMKFKVVDATFSPTDFYNINTANAQYLYLIARHFPNHLAAVGNQYLMKLISALNSNEINTVFSGYASLALSAYGQPAQTQTAPLSITETLMDGTAKDFPSLDSHYIQANLSEEAKEVVFNNPNRENAFYQFIQAGFEKNSPTKSAGKGLEIYREYQNTSAKIVNSIPLGGEIEVHIKVRALEDRYLNNIAVVDLLPGGFEVIRDSVKSENIDYVDIREDRVIFFLGVDSTMKELIYRIKATNLGEYQASAILAESMYDPNIYAHGTPSSIVVSSQPLK